MPKSQNIEERIVEMRIDNDQFESGAKKTISTLEKLERALHLKSETSGLDDLERSVSKFDANPMVNGLEQIKSGFTALEIVGMRVISNLTDSVYNFATKTIKSFTVDPIAQGFGKFGEKTTAVATLTAQGYELEKVNALMEQLNWFTDETSYNFTDMVSNIAKFTATGQDLNSSVTAMEGIALWAALSGQNAQKASMAMYQLSQAMGKGALKYDDYKSIQNASMDTQEFRRQAAAAAEELGILRQVSEGMWEVNGKTFDLAGLFSSDALSRETWFTSDVMMKVFNGYSKAATAVEEYVDAHDDIDLASEAIKAIRAEAQAFAEKEGISMDEAFKRLGYDLDEFSLKAFEAGQNARTWGDVVDSVKDAVSTGWMNTFEIIFGNAEKATSFWTRLANDFYDIFAEGGNTRNSILKQALLGETEDGGTGAATEGITTVSNAWESLTRILSKGGKSLKDFEEAYLNIANTSNDMSMIRPLEKFGNLQLAFENGAISLETLQKVMKSMNPLWTEVQKEIEASGKSMEDFEAAYAKVVSESGRSDWQQLVDDYGSIENAFEKGAVSAELFQRVLAELRGEEYKAGEETKKVAGEMTHSLEEWRATAMMIIRGGEENIYGDGEQRRKMLEEAGYDYDLMQAMIADLMNIDANMSDEQLYQYLESYYQANGMAAKLGYETFAEYMASMETTADSTTEVVEAEIETIEDLYTAVKKTSTETLSIVEKNEEGIEEVKTGADLLREGIVNLIGVVMDFQEVIRGGIAKAFGGENAINNVAQSIFNAVKGFRDWTASLRLARAAGDELSPEMQGLVNIFSVLFSVVRGFLKVVGFGFKFAATGVKVIHDIIEAIGVLFSKMGEAEVFTNLITAAGNIISALSVPIKLIGETIGKILSNFKQSHLPGILERVSNLFGAISKSILDASEKLKTFFTSEKFLTRFSSMLTNVTGFFNSLGTSISELKIGETLQTIWTWITNIFKGVGIDDTAILAAFDELYAKIEPFTSGIFGDTETLRKNIATSVSTFATTLREEISKLTLFDILKGVKLGVVTALLAQFAGIMKNIRNITASVADIPDTLAKILVSCDDVVQAYRKSIQADAYIKIATAIGILAAAMWALYLIPADRLTQVAATLAALMIILAVIVKRFIGIDKMTNNVNAGNTKVNVRIFDGMAAKLASLGILLLSVAALVALARKTDPTTLGTVMLGIVVLIGAIAIVIRELSKLEKFKSGPIVATILGLAFAIQMLLIPMIAMAVVPFDRYLQAMFGVIAMVGVLGGILMAFGYLASQNKMNTDGLLKVAGAMAIVALAVDLLVPALAVFAAVPGRALGKGVGALVIALVALGGVVAALGILDNTFPSKNILKYAGAMTLIALALNLLIPPMLVFTGVIMGIAVGIPWETLTGRIDAFKKVLWPLAGMAGILLAFGVALFFMGAGVGALGIGVLAAGAGAVLLAAAIYVLSKAMDEIGAAFPKFIEGIADAGAVIRSRGPDMLYGTVVFAALALTLGYLIEKLTAFLKIKNPAGKITSFGTKLVAGLGNVFKSMGKSVIDNMPLFLNLLGAMATMIGLYLLDVLPTIVNYAVQAITLFFSSLADSIMANKEILVVTITQLIQSIATIISEVIQRIFGPEYWAQASPVEKVLYGLAAISVGSSLINNITKPFRTISDEANKSIGIIQQLINKIKGIPAVPTVASGGAEAATTAAAGAGKAAAAGKTILGMSAGFVGGAAALVGALAVGTHLSNQHQESEFLKEALDGAEETAANYATAANNLQKTIDELNAQILNDGEAVDPNAANLLMRNTNAYNDAINKIAYNLGITAAELKVKIQESDGDVAAAVASIEASAAQAQAASDATDNAATKSMPSMEEVKANLQSKWNEYVSTMSEQGVTSGEQVGENTSNSMITAMAEYMVNPSSQSILTNSGESAGMFSQNGLADVVKRYIPQTGTDFVSGFVNSIIAGQDSAYTAGWNLSMAAQHGTADAQKSNSPSKEMMKLGGYAVDGLVLGITAQAGDAYDAGYSIGSNVMDATSKSMAQIGVMASDNFDFTPTITPVIDSSSVIRASRAMDSLYNNPYYDTINARAGDINTSVKNEINNSDLLNEVRNLYSQFTMLGDRIANMQVILDSGQLVGATSAKMDRQLGRLSARAARGN